MAYLAKKYLELKEVSLLDLCKVYNEIRLKAEKGEKEAEIELLWEKEAVPEHFVVLKALSQDLQQPIMKILGRVFEISKDVFVGYEDPRAPPNVDE
jgi:hypothetical protein